MKTKNYCKLIFLYTVFTLFNSFVFAQPTAKILFKDVDITINNNFIINTVKVKDTILLVYNLDSSTYFYAEIYNKNLLNFGNLELFKFKNGNYLLRQGVWKNTHCGDFVIMANSGKSQVLDEYCMSFQIESTKKKKIRNKRTHRN